MDIDARLADDSGHQQSPLEAVVKHYASQIHRVCDDAVEARRAARLRLALGRAA